ncbi:hypothetical protein EAH_00057500, partial [Eimeria acervulina]
FGPLGRELFLFNRVVGGGRRRQPSLAFCCCSSSSRSSSSRRVLLLLCEEEFEALVKLLPWIKTQLSEVKKRI